MKRHSGATGEAFMMGPWVGRFETGGCVGAALHGTGAPALSPSGALRTEAGAAPPAQALIMALLSAKALVLAMGAAPALALALRVAL